MKIMSNRPWKSIDVYEDCNHCDAKGYVWANPMNGKKYRVPCQRCDEKGKVYSHEDHEPMTNDEWLEEMDERLQELERINEHG